jgi:hypothetical protein
MKRERLDEEDLFELRERPVKKPQPVEVRRVEQPRPKPPFTPLTAPKADRPLSVYPPGAVLGEKRNYYISAYHPGTRNVKLLAGPYTEHKKALSLVDRARELAWTLDNEAHHMSYGTVATKRSYDFPGEYNKRMGLPAAEPKRERL